MLRLERQPLESLSAVGLLKLCVLTVQIGQCQCAKKPKPDQSGSSSLQSAQTSLTDKVSVRCRRVMFSPPSVQTLLTKRAYNTRCIRVAVFLRAATMCELEYTCMKVSMHVRTHEPLCIYLPIPVYLYTYIPMCLYQYTYTHINI